MNTELQNSILDAMTLLADNAIANSDNDRTIECEIVKVLDEAEGIYTVKYTENKFTAHSTNGVNYAVGNSVYVLIPEGDFSKNKVIIGLANASTAPKESQEQDIYSEISENLLIRVSPDIVGLCTYRSETKNVSFNSNFLSAIIKNYEHFVLKCDIKTNIEDLSQRINGNYGITISIPVINPKTNTKETVTQTIDIHNMTGNVYNFEDWSTQYLYFDMAGSTYDNSRTPTISAFVTGFQQDSSRGDVVDICITNISLIATEILSDEDLAGYYLSISATEGNR